MAKPTNTIDWTPDPGDIVEPSAGDKLLGFQPGFRPPAQWFNWFWNLVTLWVQWIDSEVDGLITAVGGDSSASSAELADRFDQGIWNPVLVNIAPADVSTSNSSYMRVGDYVIATYTTAWNNTGADADFEVSLPYQLTGVVAGEEQVITSVMIKNSINPGTDAIPAEGYEASILTTTVKIKKINAAYGNIGLFRYGTAEVRAMRFQIRYRTDGIKLAP